MKLQCEIFSTLSRAGMIYRNISKLFFDRLERIIEMHYILYEVVYHSSDLLKARELKLGFLRIT